MSHIYHALHPETLDLATPLPTSVYFSEAIYQKEQDILFKNAPLYFGHELMIPEAGDYHTLEWLGHGKMLKRAGDEALLLSNVCRHRQALILQGRGNNDLISCNIHGWTYDRAGELITAPHFHQKPCLNLGKTPLVSWNGLLFDARRDIHHDLKNLGVADYLSFENYAYSETVLTEYDFNWKTFIEVYSEDYHVDPFHPGLGNFVDCAQLKWEWGEQYHVQTVGVKNALARAGSPIYAEWHKQVLQQYQDKQPEFGAIWLTYYPNIMVEWYPHVLVVSVAIPRAPEKTTVLTEFYYPDEIVHFEPEFMVAEKAAYFETAKEDDEICYRMHDGRRALWQAGISEVGPYQSPTEEGMRHFHQYYRRVMGEI